DPQAELREPLMPKQSRTQVPSPHKKSLVDVVPAEEVLNGLDEFGDRVASLGFADDPRILQILANLHGDAAQVSTDETARNLAYPLGLKLHQVMVVLWQPPETRL